MANNKIAVSASYRIKKSQEKLRGLFDLIDRIGKLKKIGKREVRWAFELLKQARSSLSDLASDLSKADLKELVEIDGVEGDDVVLISDDDDSDCDMDFIEITDVRSVFVEKSARLVNQVEENIAYKLRKKNIKKTYETLVAHHNHRKQFGCKVISNFCTKHCFRFPKKLKRCKCV